MTPARLLSFACLIWMAAVAIGIGLRPPLPVDETRYLAVAWEMWLRDDFLVPHLNGETYSHKPPLMFWGMHAGWMLFGVNDVTPRLVAPLFGLLSLILTFGLARVIWPGEAAVAGTAPLVLIGTIFFALYSSLTMFDMMLAGTALLANLGLVLAWRHGSFLAFLLTGLGIGLGVLAKGPAILLHVLPIAFLAPLWAPHLPGYSRAMTWVRWYMGVLLAIAIGAAIGLAWALPAAEAGGAQFRQEILWGQSAGRVVNSFDHARPIWWYLAVWPPLLLPWIIWPALWRALRRQGRLLFADGGVRLCLIWVVVAFTVFSLISGKQPHYLLPEFPPLTLIAALALVRGRQAGLSWTGADKWVLTLFFAVLVAAGVIASMFNLAPGWSTIAEAAEPVYLGLPAVLILILVFWAGGKSLGLRLTVVAALSVAFIGGLHVAARGIVAERFDQTAFARELQKWDRAGTPILFIATYHGTFHFLGRLRTPFETTNGGNLAEWSDANPNGKIISYRTRKAPPLVPEDAPLLIGPYRSGKFVVWDATRHGNNPDLMSRR